MRIFIKKCRSSYTLFNSTFRRTLEAISKIFEVASGLASFACIVAMMAYSGYNLDAPGLALVKLTLRATQMVFAINAFIDILLHILSPDRRPRAIRWLLYSALALTLVAWAYPKPEHPWLPWLANLLYSPYFLGATLIAFSVVTISYNLSRLPGRRTNPSIILAGSFLCFIIVGSFLLTLPRFTYHGISYFDSLFVSASAVCITGLSPVDIGTTFTPRGLLVLACLVQLGSLGILTFTSFFAMFFAGGNSIYNQLLLRDIVYSKSMNALIPTLLYVLGFTITIEIIGAAALYFTIPDALGMDISEKIFLSAFHSMSSFCNAGFSYLPDGMANPVLMASGQNIYIVTSVLIFAGGVGFPVLVNLRESINYHVRKTVNRLLFKVPVHKRPNIYDINTRIVLSTTLIVLLIGSVCFFWLEYDNTLAGMTVYEKIVQSVFNSFIPRSAGFASVNPADFLNVTLLLVLVQMVIGGSSQSMAGGIKVNTLGTLYYSLRSVIKGNAETVAFNRVISRDSVRRAHAVLVISASACIAYILVLMLLEPELPSKALVFESVSALFTVGSSLGITPELSDASKVVLSTAMFLGRVGLISLLCGLFVQHRDPSSHLPVDSIIIN